MFSFVYKCLRYWAWIVNQYRYWCDGKQRQKYHDPVVCHFKWSIKIVRELQLTDCRWVPLKVYEVFRITLIVRICYENFRIYCLVNGGVKQHLRYVWVFRWGCFHFFVTFAKLTNQNPCKVHTLFVIFIWREIQGVACVSCKINTLSIYSPCE